MRKRLKPILATWSLSIMATFLFGGIHLLYAQQNAWTKKAPVPEKSEEFSFATVNNKIYLFGGSPAGENQAPPGIVQEYDPATDRWTSKKKMPLPAHHLAAVGFSGKIYVFGGAVEAQPGGPNQLPTNRAWEYDPAADTWKALAPMPTARMAPVAAEAGGKIYVIGGASVHPGAKLVSLGPKVPHRSLNTNEVYDPATNKWETRMAMPTARNHAAAGVVGGKIYVIGGRLASAFASAGSNSDVVEVYDPAENTWGAAGLRMPTARSAMAFATFGNRILIAGGEIVDRHMFAAIRAVEAYDPATNQWTELPILPAARQGVSGAVIGDRLYVIGGHVQGTDLGGAGADSDENDTLDLSAAFATK
ncbi:MAG TPA: kelch repeat-containing protein [Terriglobales bacterium]|nr:kelch repeat-containing protein [Terriglobales bacterium]